MLPEKPGIPRRAWLGVALATGVGVAFWAVFLWLLWSCPAFAREPTSGAPLVRLTEPYMHPHPETGEPGVWIPVWLQRAELQLDSERKACLAKLDVGQLQLDMAENVLVETRGALDELTQANDLLHEQVATQATQLKVEQTSARRKMWSLAVGFALMLGVVGFLAID